MRTAKQIQNIKDGVHKAQQRFMNEKKYIGRYSPYGYLLKERILYIDKETSHIVFLIFDLFDKGYTYTQISNYLNEHNISSPKTYRMTKNYIDLSENSIYGKWTRKLVEKCLKNRVYTGYYNYSDEPTHEAIIPQTLYKSALDRINEKKNLTQSDFYFQNGNEFSAKVFCMECGRGFNLFNCRTKDGITRYLRCGSMDTRREHKINCPNKIAIRYDNLRDILELYLEQNVYDKFNNEYLNEEYCNALDKSLLQMRRIYISQELKLLKRKLSNLVEPDVSDNNNLIEKINIERHERYKDIYKARINELEKLKKELFSFGRTKDTSKNEYIDKNVIDTFVEKIYIGKLEENDRKVKIVLK